MDLMTFSQWFTLLCSHWPPLPSAVPCPLGPLHPHRKYPLYFQILHTQTVVNTYSGRLIPHRQNIWHLSLFFPITLFSQPWHSLLPSNALNFYFDIWSRLYCDRKHMITERQKFPVNILEMWQHVAPDPQHMHTFFKPYLVQSGTKWKQRHIHWKRKRQNLEGGAIRVERRMGKNVRTVWNFQRIFLKNISIHQEKSSPGWLKWFCNARR